MSTGCSISKHIRHFDILKWQEYNQVGFNILKTRKCKWLVEFLCMLV
jgi:hypothetical protein